MIKVAILIPNYNGLKHLEDCLSSLFRSKYENIDYYVYVVDNASADGSVEYIKKNWPKTRVLRLDNNRGYAGGNMAGWKMIKQDMPDIAYLYLFNNDAIAEKNFLTPLVQYMEDNPGCGSSQSLLLMHPDQTKINSLGNVIHFLGFGYSGHCGQSLNDVKLSKSNINYASGTATLLRVKAIEKVGLFESFFFMYLEDLDLGWRLLLIGLENKLIPESVVYHKYEFKRGMKQYYYFERNRQYILLKNYKLATLVLLFPAWLVMEVGQILFAIKGGNFLQKMKSYAYFLSLSNIIKLIKKRKMTQRMRKISDRKLLYLFSGKIEFQPIENVIIKYFVNPIFNLYLRTVRLIIFW